MMPGDPAEFGWRLIGGNNRELARGAQSFETYALMVDFVQQLRNGVDGLLWPIHNDARSGKWQWRAEEDGVVVMTGGRSYERERDCRDSIHTVRIVLPDVTVSPGVTVLRANTGVHRPIRHRNHTPLAAP